jgi:hypothetical protein
MLSGIAWQQQLVRIKKADVMRLEREHVTASQRLRDFSRWALGTVLLPALLTSSMALHAQDSSETADVAATPEALTTSSSATLPRFIAHRDYLAGNGAMGLALGDLNGDGIADLVAPNFNTNNVGVLLGKANGSFQTLRLFNSGARGPIDAVVADFNADGKNDVAVTIPFSGVSIMRGDGLGHLGTPMILAAGTQPTHIVVADFNGDHRPDLAVTNLGSNNASIFLGRGDGTFSTTVSPAVGVGPEGIVAGDFNADGKVDLAVANSGVLSGTNQGTNGNTVAILLGLGTGRFQPASFIPVASTPLRLVVADFNRDTRQDLAVTSNGAEVVSVLLGNGTGTFQTPRTFSVPNATNIGVADFNTDGNLDLAVVDGEFSTVALLLGSGAGSFNPAKRIPSGTFPIDVITGDFNHDGKADYITANDFANTVSVVLGRGNGTFVDIGSAVPTNGTTHSNQIIAANLNSDGITDLAQVNTGITPPSGTSFGTSVSVLLGTAAGGFQAPRVLAIGKNGPTALAAADLNHDGALDLAVTTFGDSAQNPASLAILLGKGDGTFGTPKQFVPGPANPKSIAIADVNGDGKLDAIIAQDPTSLSVGGISVLPGDGNGNFGPQKTLVIGQPSNVVAADFNLDRKIDIAYLTDQNSAVVQLGNGDSTFQTPKVVTSSGFTTTFPTYGIGDFNNDGILDFAVEESGRIEVLLGNGQGSFTTKGKFLENAGSSTFFGASVMVADFNADGVLDVSVTIGGFSQDVSLLLGNGDGSLRAGQLFGGAATTSAVAYPVAGFQPGIAMACQDSKVRIIKNTTP